MRYFKNEQDFTFLSSFKDNYKVITEELINFLNNPNVDFQKFVQTSSAQNSINKVDFWKIIALYIHLKTPLEIFQEYSDFYQVNIEQVKQAYDYIYSQFPQTWKIVRELTASQDNGIINVFFSYFEPGAKLNLHVNDDPYMYRAHLGLIVPEGNIGFKVCDDLVKWQEGEVLVFTPTNPHTAWNLTKHPRVIMIIDFFKPDADRAEMKQLERQQFEKMMLINPWSFGMSGGYSDLDPETIKKYAVLDI
ncbi:MAG: aspartyl/asparaginyl beta-hydroxylase domain-containing protein [Symploca sp. SIO3C6]|nr:aspartyl/asparaginyl beta-hydroxylase domain-containing protein [Symploca sp. SIO3C6]